MIPLTSQIAKLYPGEALVTIAGKQSKVMADQITTASKQRVRTHIGTVSAADLRALEDAVLLHLGVRRA